MIASFFIYFWILFRASWTTFTTGAFYSSLPFLCFLFFVWEESDSFYELRERTLLFNMLELIIVFLNFLIEWIDWAIEARGYSILWACVDLLGDGLGDFLVFGSLFLGTNKWSKLFGVFWSNCAVSSYYRLDEDSYVCLAGLCATVEILGRSSGIEKFLSI